MLCDIFYYFIFEHWYGKMINSEEVRGQLFQFSLMRGINRVAVVSGLSHCRTVAEMVDILLFVPLCRMPTPIDRLEFLKTGYSLSTLKESSSRRRPK